MNHLLRLAVLTGLVFAAMSLYLAIPPDGDFWERASAKEFVTEGANPLLTIFIGPRDRPRDAWGSSPDQKPKTETSAERSQAYTNPWASKPVERTSASVAADAPILVGAVESPAPQPVAAGRTYTIAKGDTLNKIATREFGTTRWTDLLQKANPGLNPHRLIPGQEIVLPDLPGTQEPEPALESGKAFEPVTTVEPEQTREPEPTKEPEQELQKDPEPEQARAPEKAPEPEKKPASDDVRQRYKLVTIKKGDTLYGLAREHCGDPRKVGAIVSLNKDWLRRGERQMLPLGRKIKVPLP